MSATLRTLIYTILLILLAIRFAFSFTHQPSYVDKQQVSLTATLYGQPTVSTHYQKFSLGGIQIFAPRFPQYHYGDTLMITGVVSKATNNGQNPQPRLFFPKIVPVENRAGSGLVFLSHATTATRDFFHSRLPHESASLLSGIVFGSKEDFSADFKDALRTTGTLHVIAASGMNVSLVGGFLLSLFGRFFRRQQAALLAILGIILYAVLASAQPSIIRASIMGSLAFVGLALGRQVSGGVGLLLAIYAMLFVSPLLLFDIGFQLSALATAGLLFIRPLIVGQKAGIGSWLVRVPFAGDDLTTTITAQIATLPILLANFGLFSPLSVLVNALVLWTVPPLMVLGGIAAIVSFVPFLGQIALVLCLPLLFYFEAIVLFFNQKLFLFQIASLPLVLSAGYYCLLAACYLSLKNLQKAARAVS